MDATVHIKEEIQPPMRSKQIKNEADIYNVPNQKLKNLY